MSAIVDTVEMSTIDDNTKCPRPRTFDQAKFQLNLTLGTPSEPPHRLEEQPAKQAARLSRAKAPLKSHRQAATSTPRKTISRRPSARKTVVELPLPPLRKHPKFQSFAYPPSTTLMEANGP